MKNQEKNKKRVKERAEDIKKRIVKTQKINNEDYQAIKLFPELFTDLGFRWRENG